MAINFAGATDGISYALAASLPAAGCFSFRIKTTQSTANAVPAAIWGATSRFGFGFILNNTANKVLAQGYGVDGSAVGISFVSMSSVNDGAWRTITLNFNTANGGANELFIDGASEVTGNSAVAWSGVTGPVALGDNNDTFWPSYVGDMADVALWKRQLSGAEVSALGKDFSPARIGANALQFHAPLVRPARDRYGNVMTGPTGTTVSDHGRVIYPAF